MNYTLPDGNTYEIPDSDWEFAKQLQIKWESENNKPFPLYAKISRSKQKKDGTLYVKITISPENEGEKSQITYIPVSKTLTHGFRMGPKSRTDPTPVLYALQHEEKNVQNKKYFHHVRFKNAPDKNRTRVKWAIPEKVDNNKIYVYKSYSSHDAKASDIQDIGITLASPIKVQNKLVAFLEYRGTDLWKYLEDSSVDHTPETLFSMAKQCCEKVRALNEGTLVIEPEKCPPCLVNDIKPQNFTIQKKTVSLIDDEAVTPIALSGIQEQIHGYTDKYAAPEVLQSKGLNTSIASDIYSLGKTLAFVAEKMKESSEEKNRLELLIKLMTHPDPVLRITHQNIEYWFALQEKTSELTQRLEKPSLFQQQAFEYCLLHFPQVNMSSNFLDSLFCDENGPSLACTILGAAEYFSSKPSISLYHHHGSQKRPETLIASLLTAKEALTADKISEYIIPATEKSRDNSHSRKTILDKYKAIAEKFKKMDSNVNKSQTLTDDQQLLIVELNRYLPKTHLQWEKIVDNPLLCQIVKKSIDYLKTNPGWHGKNSVCKLVETLVSDSFAKKSKKNTDINTEMQKEVGKCINESAMRYKLFWFIPRKSKEDKVNSRHELLKEVAINVTSKL